MLILSIIKTIACPIRDVYGFDCFGCGFQRSLTELMHGNFLKSFEFYPPLIPLLIFFLSFLIHLAVPVKNGNKILKYLFLTASISVILNFSIKLIV